MPGASGKFCSWFRNRFFRAFWARQLFQIIVALTAGLAKLRSNETFIYFGVFLHSVLLSCRHLHAQPSWMQQSVEREVCQ